jgi:hypothetical protein
VQICIPAPELVRKILCGRSENTMNSTTKSDSNGPTFVCIGVPKAGTSWLHANLSLHPEVTMPPKKEINYLGKEYYYHDRDGIIGLLTSSHFVQVQRRKYLKRRIMHYSKSLLHLGKLRSDLIWDFNFLLMPQTEQWYFSLFKAHSVSGDISPVYYRIPEEGVYKISKNLPDLKVIILLRDPIGRVWSHTRMRIVNRYKITLEKASKEMFYESFATELEACPSYVDMISRWKKHFKEKNVFVVFYDKLVESPLDHFKEICNFLEIGSHQLPDRLLNTVIQKRHPGAVYELPKEFAIHLAVTYKSCI